MLHYCKKCGRVTHESYGRKEQICDCCKNVMYPVPNQYLWDGFDENFKDKESLFSKTQDQGKDVYNVTTTTEKELTGATINKTGTVNTAVAGTYQVVYSVKDTAGNLGTKVLTVIVTE